MKKTLVKMAGFVALSTMVIAGSSTAHAEDSVSVSPRVIPVVVDMSPTDFWWGQAGNIETFKVSWAGGNGTYNGSWGDNMGNSVNYNNVTKTSDTIKITYHNTEYVSLSYTLRMGSGGTTDSISGSAGIYGLPK